MAGYIFMRDIKSLSIYLSHTHTHFITAINTYLGSISHPAPLSLEPKIKPFS